MPSVTDVPQPAANLPGKATPPPTAASTDPNSVDAMTQSVQVLEKKLRNLGKRKEKLEGYEQEEKRGKELNKDQKEALAKYSEVLGQIECVKELIEQLKKIQSDAQRNQKRVAKQATEEKRLFVHQRLTEYAQLRYLFDHRPNSLKEEESTLLDQLSSLIVPTDNSSSTMTSSIDAVVSIYQGGAAVPKIKSLTGKTIQEIKETLEQLVKNSQEQPTSSSAATNDLQTNDELIEQSQPTTSSTAPPAVPEPTTTTTTTVTAEEEEEVEATTSDEQEHLPSRTLHEYPLKFDTREQSIPLEQIMKDSPFLPNEPIQSQTFSQENHSDPYNTILTSNNPDQSSALISNLEQSNASPTGPHSLDHQQQHEEQWQQTRANSNNQRTNQQQYNPNNRYHYQNRPPHNYYQSGPSRGPRGGRYNNNSYVPNQPGATGGPRPYHDNPNRGRGAPNPNYRGNRGGNYRGGHRGNGAYQGNGNNYPKGPYHSNNDQQVRSAPPDTASPANHQ